MRYDPNRHHRRSIRLPGYDYASPGAYFVTVCVHGRECLLGDVAYGEMRLNPLGQVANDFWNGVPAHFAPDGAVIIRVDAHVTMPNHIHAIITIHDLPMSPEGRRRSGEKGAETAPLRGPGARGRGGVSPPTVPPPTVPQSTISPPLVSPPQQSTSSTIRRPTLGQILAYYKYQTTKLVNELRDTPGVPLWQRNYWEHIIRSDRAYQRIYQYVESNPALWEDDQLHPDAPPNRFNRG